MLDQEFRQFYSTRDHFHGYLNYPLISSAAIVTVFNCEVLQLLISLLIVTPITVARFADFSSGDTCEASERDYANVREVSRVGCSASSPVIERQMAWSTLTACSQLTLHSRQSFPFCRFMTALFIYSTQRLGNSTRLFVRPHRINLIISHVIKQKKVFHPFFYSSNSVRGNKAAA